MWSVEFLMKNGKTSFFANHFGKPICLICNVFVAVNKEFNKKAVL